MSRIVVPCVVLAVALMPPGTVAAGPMLAGEVGYDPSTRLYTYTYTLDDRAAPGAVDGVYIRVATHVYDLSGLGPVSTVGPAGFAAFHVAVGGTWDESAFASGTLYVWEPRWDELATQGVHVGLSFTSRYGPGGGDGGPNYELYSTAASRLQVDGAGGFVEYGRVVAPDLALAPEPGALGLGLAGLSVVGVWTRRRPIRNLVPFR